MSGDGGKGSARRPGEIKPGAWERIFGKKEEVSTHDRAVRVLQRIEDGKKDTFCLNEFVNNMPADFAQTVAEMRAKVQQKP